ncbi:MAG: VTT domain-containing protein, partial [Nanoarchaeota archaeon]
GMFGYWIGVMGERVILEKFFSHDKIARVHKLFERYGAWAVFIAAFTPIPYKVFTIAAGVFYISLKKFIIASLIGRGMRFFLFAFLIVRYGNAIIQLIEQYEIPLLIASVALLFLGFFFYRRKKRNTLTTSSSPSA